MTFELSRNLRQDKQRREEAAYSKDQLAKTKAIAEAVMSGLLPVVANLSNQNKVSKEEVLAALREMKVDVPKTEVKIDNPPIEVKIPEIKVPEAKVTVELPEMPEIKVPKIPPIKVPKPEVTVNVKSPIIPKQEAPIVNIANPLEGIDKGNPLPVLSVDLKGQPVQIYGGGGKTIGGAQKGGLALPEFDTAALTETSERDFWEFTKGGKPAVNVLIIYSDESKGTISSVSRL